MCSFTVRKDQSKKSGVTQRMKCVRKTMHSNQSPKHPRRQKAERKWECSKFPQILYKKNKTFQIYRLSDAKQSNHESNATSVKELLRIVSEANGHLTPNLWVWSWSFLHLQQKGLYWHQSRRVRVNVLNIYNETWLYETRTSALRHDRKSNHLLFMFSQSSRHGVDF